MGNQNNFNQNQNQNQQNQQQLFAAPKIGGGGFVVTSEPVIRDTQVPSTIYKEIRITFRNTPTVTTLTTTSLVQTQITLCNKNGPESSNLGRRKRIWRL